MIKFYDSVEKWQFPFAFFHLESLYNKKISFFCNVCEAPLSSSKSFVQNSDQFKEKECFSSAKIDKVRAFYSISLNVFYENLSNPKYKSLKLFMGIFYGYTHKIG